MIHLKSFNSADYSVLSNQHAFSNKITLVFVFLCASKISACKQHMNVHVIPCTSNTTAPSSFSFSSTLFVASIQALSRALNSKTGSIYHKALRDCKYFKLSFFITCLSSFRYYPCVVLMLYSLHVGLLFLWILMSGLVEFISDGGRVT